MGLIFEPTTSPLRGWTVHRAATGELLGSVEWHDQLGVYGFAARPGLALVFDHRALEAIGRNPEAAGKVQATMFIGIAFVEALAILALVVAFVEPSEQRQRTSGWSHG